jgi:hypothetical protein
MRVTGNGPDGALAPQTVRAQETAPDRAGDHRPASAAAGLGRDSVEISGLSARILEVAWGEDAKEATRVAALAAQYARGDYQPDSAQLSRKLVSHALSAIAGGE